MQKSRLETLRDFVAANPNDSFVRYGLAQEYLKLDQVEKAIAEFQELLRLNPDYVAAYYHAGQALQKLGRMEEARQIYSRGLQAADRAGDLHARSELQAALDLL